MLTSKQTEHIRAAMRALEYLPSGAIGEYGATLADLDRCHVAGKCWNDDANTDGAQTAWRHLEAVLAAGTREPDPPATVMPDDQQAKRLYLTACRGAVTNPSPEEWVQIADEMRALVAARTARIAGREIAWWACWDRDYTAAGFASRVRREWRRMQEATK